MRKQFVRPTPETVPPHGEGWLDVERAAAVTSEEENFPVESALIPGETRGWRASIPGTQTIRLIFDQPQRRGTRIRLAGGVGAGSDKLRPGQCGSLPVRRSYSTTSCCSSVVRQLDNSVPED